MGGRLATERLPRPNRPGARRRIEGAGSRAWRRGWDSNPRNGVTRLPAFQLASVRSCKVAESRPVAANTFLSHADAAVSRQGSPEAAPVGAEKVPPLLPSSVSEEFRERARFRLLLAEFAGGRLQNAWALRGFGREDLG